MLSTSLLSFYHNNSNLIIIRQSSAAKVNHYCVELDDSSYYTVLYVHVQTWKKEEKSSKGTCNPKSKYVLKIYQSFNVGKCAHI